MGRKVDPALGSQRLEQTQAEPGLEERSCRFDLFYCMHIMQAQFISDVARFGKVVAVAMIMFVADVHEVYLVFE